MYPLSPQRDDHCSFIGILQTCSPGDLANRRPASNENGGALFEGCGMTEAWFDLYLLSCSLLQWRWETGLAPKPGPPELLRRLRSKQHVMECPAPLRPEPQQCHQEPADPQWDAFVDDTMQHQTSPWDLNVGFLLEGKNVTCLATYQEGMARRSARF